MRNASPVVWRNMCAESADLLAKAEYAGRAGNTVRAAAIWRDLKPLNQRIRLLSLMPADGSNPLPWPPNSVPSRP